MTRINNILLVFVVFTITVVSCSSDNQTLYTLSVSVNEPESGFVTPAYGEYDSGTPVEITAYSNEHWVFDEWLGDQSGRDNPISIIMDSDKLVSAQFIKKEYPLYLQTIGKGKITEQVIHQKQLDHSHGTVVELTPIPEDQWKFVRWEGDASGSDDPLQLTIHDQTKITAVFEYDSNLTRILTNEREDGSYSNDKIEGILGVEVIDTALRMYYRKGRFDGIFYIETTDLLNWTDPIEVVLPNEWYGLNRIGIFYHNGWKGHGGHNGTIYLFSSEDGINLNMVGKAFDWKIDTFYSFFFDENKNKYVAYGRVRGTAENGGWDSDSYPDIDRRGISFHSNDTWGTDWSNPGQIIADPMDYWNYDSEMIPDFYTPNVYWDENEHKYLTLTNVFWREKDREITDYLRISGNTRTTGEMYPIVMESSDGLHFTLRSEDPVIPLEPHQRYGYDPPWRQESNSEQTCRSCYEVGQIVPFRKPIQFNGSTYIFYMYKEHTHYEKPNYLTLERSIYMLRVDM